jgi:hypothetical protein
MPTTSARNFNYFSYLSDDGNTYNMRGDQLWGNGAPSGGTAAGAHPAYGRQSRRRHPRKVTFRDPGSFRTFTAAVYTPTAYAALSIGSTTTSRFLPGSATAIVYTCVAKTPEKVPTSVVGRQDLQDTEAS